MPYTLNGNPVATATVKIPRHGLWHADVVMVEEPSGITIGTRVSLAIADIVMVGTVTNGGTVAGESTFEVIGGAGGWERAIASKAYSDANGVKLSLVAGDLAADCGEELAPLEDRKVGAHWKRLAGTASSALREMVGDAWWMGLDGITHVGARPVVAASSGPVTVERYDIASGRAVLSAEDDALSRFLPGNTVSSSLLPSSIVIVETILRSSAGSVTAEVLSNVASPMAAMMINIVRALTRFTTYHGFYAYQVISDSTDPTGAAEHELGLSTLPAGVVDMRNVSGLSALPDALAIGKAHGMPGAWSKLAAGTIALVGFREGDPGQPYVAIYLPSQPTPVDLGFDATSSIILGTPGGAVELAKGGAVDLSLAAIVGKLDACCGALAIPPLGSLASVKTAKVKGQ